MLHMHVDGRSCKYEHDLVTGGQSTIVQPQRLRHVGGNRRGYDRRLRPCRLRSVAPRVDLERRQLKRLEVVCRRLAARSTFTVELAIKVLEEFKRRADLATFTAHPR